MHGREKSSRRGTMIVICEFCGKKVCKRLRDIHKHTYCSLKCMGEHRKNNEEYKEKLKDRRKKPRKLNEYRIEGEVTKIVTTKGEEILIDTEDIGRINSFTWRVNKNGYAITEYRESINKTKRVQMHRLLVNAPDGFLVDHKNRIKIDNRKSNLRICNISQNAMNRDKFRGCTSNAKGVHYNKRDKRWIAKITKNKITIEKRFKTEKEAIEQRIKWEKEYFGEFRVQ